MTTHHPNRYRVSTIFTFTRIFVFVALFSIVLNGVQEAQSDLLSLNAVVELTAGIILMSGILLFVSTRKRIAYDDIRQVIFVVDLKRQTEFEIPVESIDKILFSAIGLCSGHSYIIIHRDIFNQKQKLRLFPILSEFN